MLNSPNSNPFLNGLATTHRAWLAGFDPQYQLNWEKLLVAQPEAAMSEAGIRAMLQARSVRVEPGEDLTGSRQSLDFRCSCNGTVFFVEVTHISIEKAADKSGIPAEFTGASHYRPLNDLIFNACRGKAAQCAAVGHPV